jgi:hypothetical protein
MEFVDERLMVSDAKAPGKKKAAHTSEAQKTKRRQCRWQLFTAKS